VGRGQAPGGGPGHEDPEAVGHLIADAIRAAYDYPDTFADSLAPFAAGFGLPLDDGIGLLRWLLDLADDPDTREWTDVAQALLDGAVAGVWDRQLGAWEGLTPTALTHSFTMVWLWLEC
jgi:hypothetical protein